MNNTYRGTSSVQFQQIPLRVNLLVICYCRNWWWLAKLPTLGCTLPQGYEWVWSVRQKSSRMKYIYGGRQEGPLVFLYVNYFSMAVVTTRLTWLVFSCQPWGLPAVDFWPLPASAFLPAHRGGSSVLPIKTKTVLETISSFFLAMLYATMHEDPKQSLQKAFFIFLQ